jgi:hypothetical protein
LATIFFDQAGGLISSRFENADNSEQERLMIKLMQIKFAMALIYGFDRADKAFIDWQDGEHDT